MLHCLCLGFVSTQQPPTTQHMWYCVKNAHCRIKLYHIMWVKGPDTSKTIYCIIVIDCDSMDLIIFGPQHKIDKIYWLYKINDEVKLDHVHLAW